MTYKDNTLGVLRDLFSDFAASVLCILSNNVACSDAVMLQLSTVLQFFCLVW